MTTWERRKRAELAAKLAGIADELTAWQSLSTSDDRLIKNHTQIEAVTRRLAGLVALIEEALQQDDLARSWQAVEVQVLDLHRVWGFFRTQLLLRRMEDHAPFLITADEFAWACYRPAQKAAVAAGQADPAAVREPPLVFLGATASPVAIPRGASYAADVGGLTTPASQAVARDLPVPVVTVPWYAPQHLPEILVLGHEVGHHVEDDFGLTGTIASLVARVAGCDPRWLRWAGEVFADVYGTLCGGFAFAAVLADFVHVSGSPGNGAGGYPPTPLRLAVVRETLRLAGRETDAKELAQRWAAEGVEAADDRTARKVAEALLTGPYPELGVDRLDTMTGLGARGSEAADTHEELGRQRQLTTGDVRTLLAGAALAFASDPDAYAAADVPTQVFEHVREIQEPGTRYRAAADVVVSEELRKNRATESIERLYTLLQGAAPGVP